MKKTIAFLLIVALFLSFGGCRGQKQTIEITMDNWEEYFTLEHKVIWNQNAFGEYDSVTTSIYLSLKPEYAKRIFTEAGSDITVELCYDEAFMLGTVDPANKTYTIVAEDKRNSRQDSINVYFHGESVSCELVPGGFSSPRNDGLQDIVMMENGEITRIKGTLYLYSH